MFQTVLAVIILVNLHGVFAQVRDVPKLWNTDRLDLVRDSFILTQLTQNPVPYRPLIQGCFLCVFPTETAGSVGSDAVQCLGV